MSTIARIDFKLVQEIVKSFRLQKWTSFPCSELHHPTTANPIANKWHSLASLSDKGGNYAFLLPEQHFSKSRQITLHGPAGAQIPFAFSSKGHPLLDGWFVVYVGKTANLLNRIKGHFGLRHNSTLAQVRKGLEQSELCATPEEAIKFMLSHARLIYRELPGVKHAANRDLVELSLLAEYAPPFNIKSER